MRTNVRWYFLGLFVLTSAVWPQGQETSGSVRAVAALEQKWLESQRTSNPDLVAPLLADNYFNTSPYGEVSNKEEFLAYSKTIKFDSVDYKDLKVTAFRDTAIAMGEVIYKGTDSSGKPIDVHERFTDTWVRMPTGKWQCVASHESLVKM